MNENTPLVAHVVHRFDTGGLENGVVNLINHMPPQAYRHAVIALTEVSDSFAQRVTRPDVEFVSLHKPPGQGFRLYPRIASELRRLRTVVFHTRNLGPLEMQPAAAWMRVPVRIHGEHGWDVGDMNGLSRHHQRLRKLYSPFVHRYVALSGELASYLTDRVGIAPSRVVRLCNGVDAERFRPDTRGTLPIEGCPFDPCRHWVIGSVGRMQVVKNPALLARAFVRLMELAPHLRERVRLVMVGEGPLRAEAQAVIDEAGLAGLAWLPGERGDVPQVMRGLHAFALPSTAEGISNTILEAMASALPVVATEVGGNGELVSAGRTGTLVPAQDVESMALALLALAHDPAQARRMGQAGRAEVERRFSLQAMVAGYQALYDELLAKHGQ